MLVNPDPKIVNTRGCGPLMHYWYRRGFWENIILSLFGILMGVLMIFVFQRNRREYTQLRDEAEDRKRIIRSHSTASMNNGNKQGGKSAYPRYSYTGVRSSPSDGITTNGYDSDNNSTGVLDQPRTTVHPNA